MLTLRKYLSPPALNIYSVNFVCLVSSTAQLPLGQVLTEWMEGKSQTIQHLALGTAVFPKLRRMTTEHTQKFLVRISEL